mgnify:CR=1 FL=1
MGYYYHLRNSLYYSKRFFIASIKAIIHAFIPDLFIDTSNHMNQKEKALKSYNSQIEGNQSRSVEASKALAKFRGSQNGCDYAEAFKVVRIVI